MSKPSLIILDVVRRASSILFICLVIFGTFMMNKVPGIILGFSILMVLVGVPLFLYGLRTMERYKDIFDYEPIEFRGRQANGKQVRDYLMTLNVIGLWSGLAGIALLLIIFL